MVLCQVGLKVRTGKTQLRPFHYGIIPSKLINKYQFDEKSWKLKRIMHNTLGSPVKKGVKTSKLSNDNTHMCDGQQDETITNEECNQG